MSDQLEMDVDPCVLRWVQTDLDTIAETCVDEIDGLMKRTSGDAAAFASWAGLFLFFDQTAIGSRVVGRLEERGTRVHHQLVGNGRTSRAKKLHFYKGDGRVEAATIQSFEGWKRANSSLWLPRGARALASSCIRG